MGGISIQIPPPNTTNVGVAHCTLSNSVPCMLHKKMLWRCDVWLSFFENKENSCIARDVRATLFTKDPCPLREGVTYRFPSLLVRNKDCYFQLKPVGKIEALTQDCVSFVKLRNSVRAFFMKALSMICSNDEVRGVLGTMCFSLPCSQDIRSIIHAVGLDHIMGVSGIHFSQLAFLVTLFAGGLNRWAFSFCAWSFLTLFFLFIGPMPSVFRAWISATICVGGRLVSRRASALNSLGAGLLCLSLYEPLTLTSLSLQLSFLATAAIVIWYRSIQKFVEKALPHRRAQEVLSFARLDQCLYVVLRMFKAAFSIGCAVSLIMIPYQLAFLPDLPLMGVFSNLFLPVFFDFALLGTFFILFVFLVVPSVGIWLGGFLESYVSALIELSKEMPVPLWSMIQGFHCSSLYVSLYIAIILGVGILLQMHSEDGKLQDRWMSVI